ncbi:hypothetical protein [Burkholderia vietnamiensis]|uniref:hypothetical protein n=1 Tax=Burkholderia vietnamiensis TaxID=60552 RepID=UPI00075B9F12|nr:hypothetical protein [Burkholderia vietnamiensis]KVE52967.1 hypothetical protein WI94_19345 [Burkholderia vietnamiensis]KVE81968.1 hypothetical protein WJ00_26635 [Burkholderia vietnamiensis]MDN7924691.1 hypothetical protein [Burkholderia vietnamiensis]HDR9249736.1 hypothetical protein [Burkholderia vietnamiensis]
MTAILTREIRTDILNNVRLHFIDEHTMGLDPFDRSYYLNLLLTIGDTEFGVSYVRCFDGAVVPARDRPGCDEAGLADVRRALVDVYGDDGERFGYDLERRCLHVAEMAALAHDATWAEAA